MRISKIRPYILSVSIFTAGLIVSWLIPNIFIMNNISNDKSINLSEFEIFLNVMGSHCNFLSYNRIMVLYLLVFIFVLNYYSFSDKPIYIVRLKSRTAYIKKHLFDVIKFALIFAVLIEIINITFSLIFFGIKLTIESGLIIYSVYDFVTEALFYIRAGILLMIVKTLFNGKIAPFITFAIYFLEYFIKDYLPFLYDLWLPYKDSVQVTGLIMNSTQPADIVSIIIRGIIINIALISLSYYLFLRKDIVSHEKK